MKFKSKEFSKAVKKKRTISNNYNLRELADMLGVSHNTISRIENGKNPDIDTYCILCGWLGYSADKFLR
jgi:transcriptional regulator with XRE-family HTH domain